MWTNLHRLGARQGAPQQEEVEYGSSPMEYGLSGYCSERATLQIGIQFESNYSQFHHRRIIKFYGGQNKWKRARLLTNKGWFGQEFFSSLWSFRIGAFAARGLAPYGKDADKNALFLTLGISKDSQVRNSLHRRLGDIPVLAVFSFYSGTQLITCQSVPWLTKSCSNFLVRLVCVHSPADDLNFLWLFLICPSCDRLKIRSRGQASRGFGPYNPSVYLLHIGRQAISIDFGVYSCYDAIGLLRMSAFNIGHPWKKLILRLSGHYAQL